MTTITVTYIGINASDASYGFMFLSWAYLNFRMLMLHQSCCPSYFVCPATMLKINNLNFWLSFIIHTLHICPKSCNFSRISLHGVDNFLLQFGKEFLVHWLPRSPHSLYFFVTIPFKCQYHSAHQAMNESNTDWQWWAISNNIYRCGSHRLESRVIYLIWTFCHIRWLFSQLCRVHVTHRSNIERIQILCEHTHTHTQSHTPPDDMLCHLIIIQVAQLSQRDRAAGWVSNGQKWKTGTERQYLRTM